MEFESGIAPFSNSNFGLQLLRNIDAMARALFGRVVIRDTSDAALREIARTKIKLWRDVAANYEDAALRKSKTFHVRDNALEKGNSLAATIRHRNKRLADRRVRGKPFRVAAGMANEVAHLRDVAKFP